MLKLLYSIFKAIIIIIILNRFFFSIIIILNYIYRYYTLAKFFITNLLNFLGLLAIK